MSTSLSPVALTRLGPTGADHEALGRVGFFRLEDLTDLAPVFDLRLAEAFRGRGLARRCCGPRARSSSGRCRR